MTFFHGYEFINYLIVYCCLLYTEFNSYSLMFHIQIYCKINISLFMFPNKFENSLLIVSKNTLV